MIKRLTDAMYPRWRTTMFTTEYLMYDTLMDRLIVQVFSQGMFGYYLMYSETDCDYETKLTYDERYITLDIL